MRRVSQKDMHKLHKEFTKVIYYNKVKEGFEEEFLRRNDKKISVDMFKGVEKKPAHIHFNKTGSYEVNGVYVTFTELNTIFYKL